MEVEWLWVAISAFVHLNMRLGGYYWASKFPKKTIPLGVKRLDPHSKETIAKEMQGRLLDAEKEKESDLHHGEDGNTISLDTIAGICRSSCYIPEFFVEFGLLFFWMTTLFILTCATIVSKQMETTARWPLDLLVATQLGFSATELVYILADNAVGDKLARAEKVCGCIALALMPVVSPPFDAAFLAWNVCQTLDTSVLYCGLFAMARYPHTLARSPAWRYSHPILFAITRCGLSPLWFFTLLPVEGEGVADTIDVVHYTWITAFICQAIRACYCFALVSTETASYRTYTPWVAIKEMKEGKEYFSNITLEYTRSLFRFGFTKYTNQTIKRLTYGNEPGLVGFTISSRLFPPENYTISVWESEADLLTFTKSTFHRKVRGSTRKLVDHGAVWMGPLEENQIPSYLTAEEWSKSRYTQWFEVRNESGWHRKGMDDFDVAKKKFGLHDNLMGHFNKMERGFTRRRVGAVMSDHSEGWAWFRLFN